MEFLAPEAQEQPQPQTKFRLSAQNIFLTYPRCDAPKEACLEFLRGKVAFDYCTVAQEPHEDGTPHLHCFVSLVNKINCRHADFFDFKYEGRSFHPNIQGARNRGATRRYCQKGGDFIESGEWVDTGKQKKRSYAEIIDAASSKEEFLKGVAENHSRDFVINYERLEYFADKRFKPVASGYTPRYTEFTLPDSLQQWYNDNFVARPDRPKSLVLIGRSRLGKTEWARSLGPHVFVRGTWNAESFKTAFDYIVFDDFDFSYMLGDKKDTLGKGFFGCQGEVNVTGKWVKVFTVNTNCPVIVLMNPDQELLYRDFFISDWGRDNITRVFLEQPLFN